MEGVTDEPYRCEGCGKTSRIAAHESGCPVLRAHRSDKEAEFSLSEAWRRVQHVKGQADHAVRIAERALGTAQAVSAQADDAVVALERYIELERSRANQREDS